jgi:hypothetical protein
MVLLAAALLVAGLAACSSDEKASTSSSSSSAATTTVPEDRITTDAEVAVRLKSLQTAAKAVVAAGTNAAAAKVAVEALEPIWEPIEGTIKKNDPDTYAQIEEDLALLERAADGDAASASTASDDLTKITDAYLAKHPG